MSRKLPTTLWPPSSPQPYLLSEESSFDPETVGSEDIDNLLSKSSLHNLHFECYDECVYNDLPQYLIRINDMRLYNRRELWKTFRSLIDTITIDLERARDTMEYAGKAQVKKNCKDDIKRLLKYAIFSHRWGEEEPEFRDMSSNVHGRRPTPKSLGYEKLQHFCEKAKEYGCEYVWSDTCCINKESSSELEEAIRSMYRWYRDAFVCIVYLAESSSVKDFPQEPWFTRGWTLQELLAPERLRMYGKNWRPICPKAEGVRGDYDFPFPNDKLSDFMLHSVSKVTHIYSANIRDFNSRSPYLMVSTKMRWASKRKSTRIEDIAYSLLGIFDIMMPIAYGEGERAFQRLLEAIAQRSGDPSFFAWAGPCSRYSLALPPSPASYQAVIPKPYCDHDYAIQKRGIQLKLLVIQVQIIHSDHRYVLQPRDPNLTQNLTIIGRFTRNLQGELDPGHSYAVGVADFQFDGSLGAGGSDMGCLLPGKSHFCIFMRIAQGRVGSGVELACRRIDTKGILPLIECKSEYRGVLKTALLEHTRFLFI
ncbi:heterokaryon incompatibility protein-domain-containing protein [Lanmaoa asiatica]|nr:heterokaryon incompatibility protein-domain-containing protein [Lanmaoa asiatica]